MAAMHINEKQFREMMNEGKTVLVDYWAPWCGYCRRIAPVYDRVAQDYQDRLTAVKINIDEDPVLANGEKIEVIPTLVLYRDGKVLGSLAAPDSKAVIDAFLEKALEKKA